MLESSARRTLAISLFLFLSLGFGVFGIVASSRQRGNPPPAPPPNAADSSQSSIKPLDPIQPAPEFSMSNVLGGEVNSKDLKGKIVVVEFWATWAVPSVAAIPEYNQLQKKFKSQGVEFLAVTYASGSSAQDVVPFLKRLLIEYPVVMGTAEVDRAFGGHLGYPTTFLIGRDWKIYRKILGSPPNKYPNLERDILSLLEKPTN